MKRVILLILFPLRACLAMYAGNAVAPDMPETGLFAKRVRNIGTRVAYTYDHTVAQPLKFSKPGSTKWLTTNQSSLEKQGVSFGATLGNQIELYASLGRLAFKPSGVLDHFSLTQARQSSAYFGGGGKVILVFFGNSTMGIDAKYHGTPSMLYNGLNKLSFKGVLHNWQLSFTLGREFGWFNPYVGFAFETFRSKLHQQQAPSDWAINLEEDNPWLCILGVGVAKNKLGYLNIEGRLIGEFALGLRASLSF